MNNEERRGEFKSLLLCTPVQGLTKVSYLYGNEFVVMIINTRFEIGFNTTAF